MKNAAFRPAELGDRDFILDGFVASYRMSHTAGLIMMEDWRETMWRQFTKALDRPTVTTIVAYDPREHDHVVDLQGFITADVTPGTPLVYYVYVKGAYRKEGYARALFAAIGIDPKMPFLYACKTWVVAEIVKKHKIPRAVFDNNAARYPTKTDPRRRAS